MNGTKLKTEQRDHILWVRIDRPDTLNAIDFDVMEEFENILDLVEPDENIRVFILSGNGNEHFTSGGDLYKFAKLTNENDGRLMARRVSQILERIEALECWTIACINGSAYGGGCEFSLAFDLRIASKKAQLGFTQGRFYLPPGWGGMTRLVELVGRSTALEWLGKQEIIDAETAKQQGLINHVVSSDDLESFTMEWAQKLSSNDRKFITALKLLARHAHIDEREISFSHELEVFGQFWETDEHFKRLQQFLDRKDP